MAPKQPAGPAITLGNMRQLGVQRLVAYCLNDACRHTALIDVSSYPAGTEVPWFGRRAIRGQVRQQARRCSPKVERATCAAESDRQGVAMSRAILGDAIFAIVFSIVIVTFARFLWAML